MSANGDISLSVVVATDGFDAIEELVAALQAQSVRDRLELVVVAPSLERLAMPERAGEGLAAVQVVEAGEAHFELLYRARAAGVRAASAPVILFAETHCFPEPEWAEALIEAHEGDWTAICPAFLNANPSGSISWSNLVIDYGRWLAPGKEGPVSEVPGHNSSFKRAALLEYGPRLDELIVQDKMLIDDLAANGHRFYFAPAARSRHLNVDRPKSWLAERFVIGRTFAATRAADWPWSRRLLYAAGSPLIPFVRLRRVRRDVHEAGYAEQLLPGILPALCAGLGAGAVGEFLGYAFGPSERAVRRMSEIEVRRLEHVRPRSGETTETPQRVTSAGSLDAG